MKVGWCEWWAATIPERCNQGSSPSPRRPNSFFLLGLTVCVGTHEGAAEVEGQRAGHLAVPWLSPGPTAVRCVSCSVESNRRRLWNVESS